MTETERLANVIAQVVHAETEPILRRIKHLEDAGATRAITVYHENGGGAGLEGLERRLRALEARPAGLKYCGVHDPTLAYGLGDCVTEGGSMFVSKVPANKGLPGKSSDWQLAVKRGRDAR